MEGIRFLSRVEIEVEDPEELTEISNQKKTEIYEHKDIQTSFVENEKKERKSEQTQKETGQGNRRLRRYEAKMARKNQKKSND